MTAEFWGVTFKYGKGELTRNRTENNETRFLDFNFFFFSVRSLAVWKIEYTLVKFVPLATVSCTLSLGKVKFKGSVRTHLESQYHAPYRSIQ